jgi:hypothetical protein
MVADLLLKEFPNLSIDKLMAAIRACDHEVKRSDGRDALVTCTKRYLRDSGGTGEPSSRK